MKLAISVRLQRLFLVPVAILLSAVPAIPGNSAPAPRFAIIDLGRYMAREPEDKPGLNASGDVAAWQIISENSAQAALLKGGRWSGLENPRTDVNTFALGLDDQDVVVGIVESRADLRNTQAFLWDKGLLQVLPTLGGRSASAHAINQHGLIVGSAQTADQRQHATLWRDGKPRDLGVLARGDYSRAFAVNRWGEVAGEANLAPSGKPHAVVWWHGGVRDLGLLPGGAMSTAIAINGRHQVVGYADNDDGSSRPVLWSAGRAIDLGSFGDDPNVALDINDAGQVVGTSAVAEGKMRAFLWEKGHLQNLNEVIPQQSGWLLLAAYRINSRGQILAYGSYRGKTHVCILNPQPALGSSRH